MSSALDLLRIDRNFDNQWAKTFLLKKFNDLGATN